MENIDLLSYAVPFFILLLLVELGISTYEQKDWFESKDTLSSLAMGSGNFVVGFLAKVVVFFSYSFVYQFHIFEIGSSWWAWVLIFFAEDFSYYWFHRISHTCRFFWASHVVHHSSQKYNLSTALRQTWTGQLTGTFVFWLWMALIGFHPIMIMMAQSISLIYQFWIHTEAIGKFPAPIEFIFNTPSHHRVHHSSEIRYLDSNHAGVLIIWDRMFGTFVEEDKRPIYGLTNNINTNNPVKIAFHEWIAIFKDIKVSGSFKNALMYIFGPPGWSHDGSRKTTKQLRTEIREKTIADTPF